MSADSFNKTIDTIQSMLVGFVIVVVTVCIAVLFLFDVLAGTGTMLYLTGGKAWQSVVISLSTTGLLFALMFIGYSLTDNKNQFIQQVGKFIMLMSGLIYLEDVIFDALLADILRYGTLGSVAPDSIQWMFRVLLGGISTVGDALAFAMILGMPVLKNVISSALAISPEKKLSPDSNRVPNRTRVESGQEGRQNINKDDRQLRHQRMQEEEAMRRKGRPQEAVPQGGWRQGQEQKSYHDPLGDEYKKFTESYAPQKRK